MKSGEWREVWGTFAAVAEPGQLGNASGASGTTAPTNRVSIHRNPQGFGRQGCACGRGMPRPYEWGNIRGRRGTGAAAQCSCGPDSPQGCPAIRPLQMGENLRPSRDRGGHATCRGPDGPQGCPAIRPLRWSLCPLRIRKVPGGNDVSAGGACPAPTNGGFAAIAEPKFQRRCPPYRSGAPLRPFRNRAGAGGGAAVTAANTGRPSGQSSTGPYNRCTRSRCTPAARRRPQSWWGTSPG